MLKTYQFKDVIVHKRASHLNALEYCSLYPNRGVGFKIRRKTWPKGVHLLLKDPHFKVFIRDNSVKQVWTLHRIKVRLKRASWRIPEKIARTQQERRMGVWFGRFWVIYHRQRVDIHKSWLRSVLQAESPKRDFERRINFRAELTTGRSGRIGRSRDSGNWILRKVLMT